MTICYQWLMTQHCTKGVRELLLSTKIKWRPEVALNGCGGAHFLINNHQVTRNDCATATF